MSFLKQAFLWLVKKLLRLLGILVEVDKPLHRFPKIGFSGELGYALFGLLPYLNFIRQEHSVKIVTLGSEGSSAFFDFSDEHIEVGRGSTSSWGTITGALRFRKYASFLDPIFVPVEWYDRRLRVSGLPEWESNKLHILHPNYAAWRIPELRAKQESDLRSDLNLLLQGPYCVVNLKNYLTWSDSYVANWYEEDDLRWILEFCEKRGMRIVANRSPVSPDFDEPIVPQPFLEAFLANPAVFDISVEYQKLSIAEGNSLQLRVLSGASHVWATQGGNAFLAMMCNHSVSVLMRGGSDFEDFKFFSKEAGLGFFEVIYSAQQSRKS